MSSDLAPSVDQLAKFIEMVPLFHELDGDQVQSFSKELEVREFAANDTLLTQGMEAEDLFIMLQGEAAAFTQEQQYQRMLKRFVAGEYFGMTNVVTRKKSPFTIQCLTACRVVVVNRQSLDRMFETSPAFAKGVCRSLASFVAESIEWLPKLPFRTLEEFPNRVAASRLLPARISTQLQAVAVEQEDGRVVVAIVNPDDTRAVEFIKDVLNLYMVEFVAISLEDFKRHAAQLFPASPVAFAALDDTNLEIFQIVDSEGGTSPITDGGPTALAVALAQAVQANASDIHIESKNDRGAIRLRVDGRMISYSENHTVAETRQMMSRIKVAAGLDITNVRRPQDGRFRIEAQGQLLELRVSAMPSDYGEKLVLRLASSRQFDFSTLFATQSVARFAADIFSQPSGLILVAGPTGSGKTTTLYSALQMLHRKYPEKNFVTIEDPVEYPLEFATQTRVDEVHHLGFPQLLRFVFRQDPDVILVGEIRDRESAAMAVEAATTGHLVLSTLHTHSALDTLARLRNLNVPPYLIADAVKGVISQRLLPKLAGGASEVGGNDEVGRIALFEMLAVSNELSELVEQGATRKELAEQLTEGAYLSFEQYGQLLVDAELVAPTQLEQVLPKLPTID